MKHCPRCSTSYGDDVATCPLDGAVLSSAPRRDPFLDRVVKGRYRILGKLGEGGMGAVYRAEQLSVGRTVALKVLHREFARDPEFVQRFQQEARLAAALNHPRLTTVFDFDQSEDGSLFIVMEYLEGTLLSDLIRQAGPLDVGRVVRLAIQIAEGVEAAHAAGVIHRDIKPQNIAVLGPADTVKLMDFGIARLHDGGGSHLTRAGTLMGTPLYMAPEQVDGRPVSAKTDIYAFGVVLYEMLAGRTPFSAPTSAAILAKHLNEPVPPLRSLRPDVSPLLEQIVMQALEKEPEFRQERFSEIVRRLRTVGGAPAAAPDATFVGTATMVSGPARAPIAAGEPSGSETMFATATMVSGREPDPTRTWAGAAAPAAGPAAGAAGAARPSRWARLRDGRGKVIVIAAGVLLIVLAASVVGWMTWPAPAAKPIPQVATTEPPKPKPMPPPEPLKETPRPDPRPPEVRAPTPPPPPAVKPPPSPTVEAPSPPRPVVIPERPALSPGPVALAPAPAPLPAPRPSLKASVEQTLRASKLLRPAPDSEEPGVLVDVNDSGQVTLRGVLRDAADIQRARDLVRAVDGVTAVNTERVLRQWTVESR